MLESFALSGDTPFVIYLDNNATTRPDDDVIQAMAESLAETYANPSSLHREGQKARRAVDTAREQVARLIGADPRNIIFTSGGTESNHLAILGTLDACPTRRHIVISAVEHVAVLSLCERLATRGYQVTQVPVDREGGIDPAEFEHSLTDETALAAVMYANNETGIIFPVERLSEIAASRGIPFHVDAVQAAGKIPLQLKNGPITTLALSAHKFHGPKGVGALYVSRNARLRAQLAGGHQERDLRPGTENVAGIVGLGIAARHAASALDSSTVEMARRRDRLEARIIERIPQAVVIGRRAERICNTTTICFPGLEAEPILIGLSQNDVCVSSGSACSSGAFEPSHVLRAMKIEPHWANGAIRFSLSKWTTESEVDVAVEIVTEVVSRLDQRAGS